MTADTPLRDTDGTMTTARAWARAHQVRVAPTVLFLDRDGKQVAGRCAASSPISMAPISNRPSAWRARPSRPAADRICGGLTQATGLQHRGAPGFRMACCQLNGPPLSRTASP